MKLDGSQDTKRSNMGALLSIFQFVIVSMFSVTKFLTWLQLDDVNIFQAVSRGGIDQSHMFSAEQGFFFAAAITEYDSNPDIIEEARYGELVFENIGWGYGDELLKVKYVDLSFDYCTKEQLGLEPSTEFSLFPIKENQKLELEHYQKKFKCPNSDQVQIWGDYNSLYAQQLTVSFKMCEGHDYCESRENIIAWLRRKFILLVYNEIRFELDGYGNDVSVQASKLVYLPVSTQAREIIPYKVQLTELELQDNMGMMLGDLTMREKDDIFEIKNLEKKPYEKLDNIWLQVTVEMDFDVITYEREVYTSL